MTARSDTIRFSPPRVFVFFSALALAVLALVDKLGLVPSLPNVFIDQPFWLALLAYFLMFVGSISNKL